MEKTTFTPHATCRECRFSDTHVNSVSRQEMMICRLKPPFLAHAFVPTGPGKADVVSQSLWPVVAPTDWCSHLETKTN
jgi:hypothetical protein